MAIAQWAEDMGRNHAPRLQGTSGRWEEKKIQLLTARGKEKM